MYIRSSLVELALAAARAFLTDLYVFPFNPWVSAWVCSCWASMPLGMLALAK